MKKVLIIIPTYNEANNIKKVVDEVERVINRLKSYDFNLLIVDDHSPDGTAKHVKTLQVQYSNISLLSGKRAGYGRAYISGFRYALKQDNYDIFIMMDADLSHKPEDIPALLKPLAQGADYVIGSRYITGGSVASDWPLLRRINSHIANYIVHKLVEKTNNVNDLTSGFKAISREALVKIDLSSINALGYVFQVSLLHAFLRQGFIVKEVPITFEDRHYGSSKIRLKDIIEFLYRTYKLSPNAPIQKFVRFGFIGSCGAVVNLLIITILARSVHVNTLLSDLFAVEGSIIFNFFLNRHYILKGYGSYRQSKNREKTYTTSMKLGIFNLGALGGGVISFLVFAVLLKQAHIYYMLADIIAILIALSWNYWISTRFVWRAIDARKANHS
jgi:dolichol-phosphate mannosyltransferase